MRHRIVTTHIRAGALALAGITPYSRARSRAATGPPARQGAEPAPSWCPSWSRSPRVAGTRSRCRPLGALGRRVERLARSALRAQSSRPHFPVRGEFNWGQDGARFGASRAGAPTRARTCSRAPARRWWHPGRCGAGDRQRRRTGQLRGAVRPQHGPDLRLPAHERAREDARGGAGPGASASARSAAPGAASAITFTSRSATGAPSTARPQNPLPLLCAGPRPTAAGHALPGQS